MTDVGLVSAYPMRGRLESSLLAQFHGEPFDAANPPGTRQRFASPGLFAAMGTPIIKGRDFGTGDLPTTVPVAIVNHVFVDRYLKGRDPIGVQFSAGYPAARSEERGDDRRRDRRRATEVARRAGGGGVLATADADSASARDRRRVDVEAGRRRRRTAIRAEVRKLNPTMALDFELASDVVGGTLRRQELGMTLMLVFGGIAIVLAAVGIYGVVSYAGSLRREEMATRLALGASPHPCSCSS